MESDGFALRTALFVIGAIVLTALTWTVFKDAGFAYKPFVVMSQDSVSGLDVKARIYYKGVEVGVVENIYFVPDDFDRVRILIHVDETIPIAQNTYAQLALRGITGEYDLRLDNDGPLGDLLPTSVESPGVITMRSEYITKITESLESTLIDISDISHRVSQLLSDDNRDQALQTLEAVADAGHSVVALEKGLAPTLDRLPMLADQVSDTLVQYGELARLIAEQSSGLDGTLTALAAASARVEQLASHVHTQTLTEFDQSLHDLSQTNGEVRRLLEDLRDDPQRLLLGSPITPRGPGEVSGEQRP